MSTASFGDPRGLGQRAMESRLVVSIYESHLWRRNPLVTALMGISFERELECIARAARLEQATKVLDLACGPGIYTRPLARRLPGGRIVGLDYSRPMLAYARRRARAERVPNLDLLRATALSLPFRSATFDVVNCCGALHLFPDVPRALEEVHRVLVEGGRFTTAVVRADDTARGRRVAASRHRLLGLHSFTRPELEERLKQAGLTAVEVLHEHGFWMLAVAERG
jgi:SAM-dependent methyltransferase